MDGPIGPVEVQAVKGCVGDDPIRDLEHVFILDQEVACCPATVADHFSRPAAFTAGVLIQLGGHALADVPTKLRRAEAVGELYPPEVVDNGIKNMSGQVVQGVVSRRVQRQVLESHAMLRFAALDEGPEGEVRPTCLVEIGDKVAALQLHPLNSEAPRLQLFDQSLWGWAEVRVAKDVSCFQRLVERQLLCVPRVVLMQVPALSVQQRPWMLGRAVLEQVVVQLPHIDLDAPAQEWGRVGIKLFELHER